MCGLREKCITIYNSIYVITATTNLLLEELEAMRPLQISPETAVTLSKQLGVPLEQLMHMPQHILMQKIAELAKNEEATATKKDDESPSSENS